MLIKGNTRLLTIALTAFLTGCTSDYRLEAGQVLPPESNNDGYLSLVIDTLDPLRKIEFIDKQSEDNFYVGAVPVGVSQLTLKVPEGEYCFNGFDVYRLTVNYRDQGFCTYVEAGEVNYMGDFMVRDPITSVGHNYDRFLELFAQAFPQVCDRLIRPGC